MGIKFNPLGDPFDLVNAKPKAIDLNFIAGEVISAMKVVYALNPTTVMIASTASSFKPIGIALNAAGIGDLIKVRTFGELSDGTFSFASDTPLFFNLVGTVTSTNPTTGYHTEIGHALGTGKIFINIKNQITL